MILGLQKRYTMNQAFCENATLAFLLIKGVDLPKSLNLKD